jgi:hypothetical protein
VAITRFKRLKVNWMALAFIVLALVVGYALTQSVRNSNHLLYRSQIESCERGNDLRRESNRRIDSHYADTDALKDFLLSAAQARYSAWNHSHQRADLMAFKQYEQLSVYIDTHVVFRPTPIVKCTEVVHKP